MKPLRRGWRRLEGAFGGGRREDELAEELASHIEMQEEDNRRAGMAPAEARRAARLKFGNLELAKESYRGQRGLPLLEALFTDVRYALRGLRKSPGFTFVAVLTLALGIGANTAVFSLVDQVLLAPPGIRNPERVIAVQTSFGKLHLETLACSPHVLADLYESPQVFEQAALASMREANYTGGREPQGMKVSMVTAGWFDVFGARPHLGRVFTREEDQPNNRVAVLSYGTWVRIFGGDPSILGRNIELNLTPYRVVGVMPPDFRWPQKTDVWSPAGLAPAALALEARFGNERYLMVARARPEVSFRGAKDWMRILTDRVRNGEEPQASVAADYAWSLTAVPFAEALAGETRKPLLFLAGAVGLVLLIACSNIAGLLLARASARGREFAVRSALGASRGRLLRSVMVESLVLALAGGAAGMALAYTAVELLLQLAPPDAVIGLQPRMDLRVLLFCAVAAVVSALLFGMAPAWQISRTGPNSALKGEDRGATGGRGRQRVRSVLVVAESALALMLLVTGGLFLRSFVRLQSTTPGFEPKGVMTAVFLLPQKAFPGVQEQTVFYRALLDRLNRTPGIVSASVGTPVPFSGADYSDVFQIEGRAPAPGQPLPFGDPRLVSAGYFQTLGIPLKRGRYFTEDDRATGERVAVIDENLARKYWPGEDPIGKRIQKGDTYQIVGIVGHVTHSNLAADSGHGVFYLNMLQRPAPAASILVKTRGDLPNVPAVIREAVRETDSRAAVHEFRGMQDAVAGSLAPRLFGMRLVGCFAAMALFLAALGLYGVISYSVAQRKREIGIRIALGAAHRGVARMVVGQGLRLAAAGTVLGIVGSLAGARVIQSQLFEVSAFDPATIAVMAAVLLAASVLASYLPARRAIRVDPAIALRPE